MQYIMPTLVAKYQHTPELAAILTSCCELASEDAQTRNYYKLLLFISLASKKVSSEEELVEQLKQLLEIVSECEVEAGVQANTLAVMKCLIAMLSLNS